MDQLPQIKRITAIETHALRRDVLDWRRCHGSLSLHEDTLPSTTHWGCFSNQHTHFAPVGVVTLIDHPFVAESDGGINHINGLPQWQLRGMAVDGAHQGQGLGGLLLAAVIRYVKTEKQQTGLWANARHKAVRCYERQGFVVVGEPFDIPFIGQHFQMMYQGDTGSFE